MVTSNFKLQTLLAATVLVAGCKLTVISPPGGDVTSPNLNCAGGTVCEVTIDDTSYADTFTANPKPGYEFLKWQRAAGFFCGDSAAPCTVELPADNDLAAAIVGVFATGYIMPVYNDIGIDTDGDGTRNELDEDDDGDSYADDVDGCPLNPINPCQAIPATDIVSANGKQWAQPAIFSYLTWNMINAACPSGVCGSTAILNGYDMSGWTWAGLGDLESLINSYGVSPPTVLTDLNLINLPYYAPDSSQVIAFRAAGWHLLPFGEDGEIDFVAAYTRDVLNDGIADYYMPVGVQCVGYDQDYCNMGYLNSLYTSPDQIDFWGAGWFYR